jgi:hypothetical protein
VSDVRFYTIADQSYFLGLVAMVNSLRFHGHRDPVTVLDLGLLSKQRAVLQEQCEFVVPPDGVGHHPWMIAPYVCLARPADTVIYIDSDIIVTRPLWKILDSVQQGRVCVYEDEQPMRWFAEWKEIFGLRSPPRKQKYVSAGFVAFSTVYFPTLLSRWSECCERMVGHPTDFETPGLLSPTAYPDQDALNALLMSEVAPAQIHLQPANIAAQGLAQLQRARVVDVQHLDCRLDGAPLTLLHASGSPKPWQRAAAKRLRSTSYLLCLRRMLVGRDVTVPISPQHVPIWLRRGFSGRVALWALTTLRRASGYLLRYALEWWSPKKKSHLLR